MVQMPALTEGLKPPKGPVFGWANFRRVDAPGIPSVEDLPQVAYTTSGRAAIYQALKQLGLPEASLVLVPTYHCPTMVGPIVLAGLVPAYFGIGANQLPDVTRIDPNVARRARAMIVSHYFGLPQSLQEVRAWCDKHGVVLIEDCAHAYFGQAGERAIGAWGDFCTASVSKFFPVPEAGLLGSALRPLKALQLPQQGAKAQIKGVVDVLEISSMHGRLQGLNIALASVLSLKGKRAVETQPDAADLASLGGSEADTVAAMMTSCDLNRVNSKPLLSSMLIRRILPRGRIIATRRRNFALYAKLLSDLPASHFVATLASEPVAPYVFPLWVDDAQRVYHALRLHGVPVFRWDRIWPGTPVIDGDIGLKWSQHLLQFLCHQDLSEEAIRWSAQCLTTLLKPQSSVRPTQAFSPHTLPCPN